MTLPPEPPRRARIGLRVISSAGWRGGVQYIVNWVRACARVPANERPELWLLPYDERGNQIAAELSGLVAGIHPFAMAAELDLDMVYPATQIFEAPFDAPWAGWVPDWQCKYLPELFDDVELARRDLHYGLLATRAPLLVLSSRMAIEDSRRLFGDRLVPHAQLSFPALFDPSEVTAARLALPSVKARFGVPDRYFLVANQWWRHKNHEVVVDAMARLGGDVPVVCTGATSDHRWPDYPQVLLDAARSQGLASRLMVLGSIDRADQVALMLGATAIIQPSRFEGWSTIVEEARAIGLPLILSRIPVHEEQSPPGSCFFDCDDADGLALAMRAALDAPVRVPVSHEETQADYVRRCVVHLSEIALAVRSAYDPVRHDPALLLADLTASVNSEAPSAAEQALAYKVLSATRAMLAGSASALERYDVALASRYPDKRSALEKAVVMPSRVRLRSTAARAPLTSPGSTWLGRIRNLLSR